MNTGNSAAIENIIDILKGAVEMFGGTVKEVLDAEVTHCVCYVPQGSCNEDTFAAIVGR